MIVKEHIEFIAGLLSNKYKDITKEEREYLSFIKTNIEKQNNLMNIERNIFEEYTNLIDMELKNDISNLIKVFTEDKEILSEIIIRLEEMHLISVGPDKQKFYDSLKLEYGLKDIHRAKRIISAKDLEKKKEEVKEVLNMPNGIDKDNAYARLVEQYNIFSVKSWEEAIKKDKNTKIPLKQ